MIVKGGNLDTKRISTGRLAHNIAFAGRGRPILFLHGLGWSWKLWEAEIERYADRYRVIAPDTRGHGGSDVPSAPYSIPGFADDWIALLDTLGITKCAVVGFSQGGMAAQELVAKRPDLVEALVLASTTCKSSEHGRANMELRIKAMESEGPEAAARVAAKSVFADAFIDSNPDYIDEFVKWRATMSRDGLVASMRAGNGFDVSARLKDFKVPTLVIAGNADKLTKPESVREVATRIPGAIYEEIDGAGHMLPIEMPAAFNALLETFFARHYAPELVVT